MVRPRSTTPPVPTPVLLGAIFDGRHPHSRIFERKPARSPARSPMSSPSRPLAHKGSMAAISTVRMQQSPLMLPRQQSQTRAGSPVAARVRSVTTGLVRFHGAPAASSQERRWQFGPSDSRSSLGSSHPSVKELQRTSLQESLASLERSRRPSVSRRVAGTSVAKPPLSWLDMAKLRSARSGGDVKSPLSQSRKNNSVSPPQCTPQSPSRSSRNTPSQPQTPSQSQYAKPRRESLKIGASVLIDGHCFEVTCALGQGSFGTVWGADSPTLGKAAIKEIQCACKSALADAQFEGELLRRLHCAPSSSLNDAADVVHRIPNLLALESESLAHEKWRVSLAMTRICGEPLSKLLDERTSTKPVTCSEAHEMFARASKFATELLVQLVPTLGHVSTYADHRDVTPRNILVEDGGARPKFGLIDFGLAVDSLRWRTGGSSLTPLDPSLSAAWQHVSVAGDGRYWPVSSWFMFQHGAAELSRESGLLNEYKRRLDYHSLGITAVQVVAELSPLEPHDKSILSDPVLKKLWRLRSVWEKYWADATRFWLCIYQTFQKAGDFDALRAAYIRSGVHDVVRKDLCALRSAIEEAQLECASCDALSSTVPVLLEALMMLVSTGEECDAASTWQSIQAHLTADPESPSSMCLDRRTPDAPLKDAFKATGATTASMSVTSSFSMLVSDQT